MYKKYKIIFTDNCFLKNGSKKSEGERLIQKGDNHEKFTNYTAQPYSINQR
jgi:hypothetical protein